MAWVYFDGAFVPESDPCVSAFDGGLLHGAGLFETMRAEAGRVFRFEHHLARLLASAEKLLRPMHRHELPAAEVPAELMERNGLRSARMRLTVTTGSLRGEASTEPARPTVLLTAAPLVEYPPEYYRNGVAAVVCPFRVSPTDPLAGHKSTAYLPRLLGLRDAQSRGAVEGLWFTTDNHLTEGSISSVFLVAGGVLKTPPVSTPVLPGIVRAAILEIAAGEGLEVSEAPLTINDLLDAEEVLLTNIIMQVMPVVRVERRDIGGGCVGPMAKRMLAAFRELIRKECPPE